MGTPAFLLAASLVTVSLQQESLQPHVQSVPASLQQAAFPRRARATESGSAGPRSCAGPPSRHKGIPRVIHQIWIQTVLEDGPRTRQAARGDLASIAARNRQAAESWQRVFTNFTLRVWGNDDVRALVREHHPRFLNAYDNYITDIQRSDAARYLILSAVGGVYVDSDTLALRPYPDEWFDNPEVGLLFTHQKLDKGVNNGWLASAPGHPLWDWMLDVLWHTRRWYPVEWCAGPPVLNAGLVLGLAAGVPMHSLNSSMTQRIPPPAGTRDWLPGVYSFHGMHSTWSSQPIAWARKVCGCKDLPRADPRTVENNPCLQRCFAARNITVHRRSRVLSEGVLSPENEARFQACAGHPSAEARNDLHYFAKHRSPWGDFGWAYHKSSSRARGGGETLASRHGIANETGALSRL